MELLSFSVIPLEAKKFTLNCDSRKNTGGTNNSNDGQVPVITAMQYKNNNAVMVLVTHLFTG